MEIQTIVDLDNKHKLMQETHKMRPQISQDLQTMTSSTISMSSSLASPGDSGVQMLDSESSEDTSVMSVSCNFEEMIEKKDAKREWKTLRKEHDNKLAENNQNFNLSKSVPSYFDKFEHSQNLEKYKKEALNKSLSDEVFEMEHPIKLHEKSSTETDLMNISLNSYELLDYTLQNKHIETNDQMHVSLSEEVNENLKINLASTEPIVEDVPIVEKPEEQIVFRRQRKKKSKSDTPKKRVSFHEDILNSTKIDDIHINHGFITHEPDVSLSFFQRGFVRKPDVVKGRYSWAAEGKIKLYQCLYSSS